MQLSLKKSYSLYDKKDTHQPNPESIYDFQGYDSHVQEMIFQKYNFSHRLKTNNYQKPSKNQLHNNTSFVPISHVIAVAQLPKLERNSIKHRKQSIFDSFNKIKTKQIQDSIEDSPYTFVHFPPRKVSDYNQCIKRIQMNTTYRGFNYNRASKMERKVGQSIAQNDYKQKHEENKTPLKSAERKMIIQNIIDRGFARKMEDSLIKARKEKKRVYQEIVSKRNRQPTGMRKQKRSVIFSSVQSTPVCKVHTLRNLQGKQSLIEPW